MKEGKPITWTVLSSLLFQMENEQAQIEWVKEYWQIINDEITFDYSIKEGSSKTKNAIELLRITEFPSNVYTRALQNTKGTATQIQSK